MFKVPGKTQQGAIGTHILRSVSYFSGNKYWSHIFRRKYSLCASLFWKLQQGSMTSNISHLLSAAVRAQHYSLISPMTSVSMVISLSVQVCLNKLFWWPAAIQNQLPATRWLSSPSPNSCLGPFNSTVKHTYCKVGEQDNFLLQVMGFVASLAACDGRP